jgi:hypothetical protein
MAHSGTIICYEVDDKKRQWIGECVAESHTTSVRPISQSRYDLFHPSPPFPASLKRMFPPGRFPRLGENMPPSDFSSKFSSHMSRPNRSQTLAGRGIFLGLIR